LLATVLAWACLVTLPARAAVPSIDASSPQALVETSSRAMLADLDAHRDEYRKDISGLYKVVDAVFLPHVDVTFAAQQVLGTNWRSATPEQRKRFIDAFYKSLLSTYGDALLEFTSDRMRVLPFQGDPSAARASVRTEIRRGNGAAVAVNYSLRKTGSGEWKVWDVVIEGISYVKSFREDFNLEIQQKGLEALLQRLESEGAARVK